MPLRQREKVQEVLRRKSGKLNSLVLFSTAIILFWVVMTGLFLHREGKLPFFGGNAKHAAPRITEPLNTWMGIYLPGDARIGFVNTSYTPDSRNGQLGTSINLTSELQLTLLFVPTRIYIGGTAWLPQGKGIAEFNFNVRSADHIVRIAATINDGLLDAHIYTAGEDIPFKFPVNQDLLLAGGMGTTTINVPVLDVGEETQIDAFDPMTLSMGKARVKCIAEQTIEILGERVDTRVVAITINGLTSKAWIADNEEVVQAEAPFGFVLRKITPEEAIRPVSEDSSSTLMDSVAVQPTGMKPFRGARKMTVRFSGVSADRMPPTDETQTAVANVYTITALPEPKPETAAESEKGQDILKNELKNDAFVQSDHSRIKEAAAGIVGTETETWKKAMLIYDWVFANIRKVPVFSLPSALEVLESKEGDCNEHTVLYTALARAVGVPTRIAIGLVWSEDLNGFYYHAWPEVYAAGGWTWIDPTLGQRVADATHIKLLNGSIETWPQMLPYLGQLEIEVIAIE